MKSPLAAYFDQGQVPNIDCVFLNTIDISDHYGNQQLVNALQKYQDEYYGKVWGIAARITLQKIIRPGNWGMVFVDDPDIAGALGYHDLTKDGLPISKIFVKTTRQVGDEVSVTASHELEMEVDPGIQMIAQNLHTNVMYAYETHDAVEAEDFQVDGIPMSNFQYPSWFESFRKAGSTKFDHLGTCKRPFQINKGGYMSIIESFGGWKQIFGSKAAEKDFNLKIHSRAKARTLIDDRGYKSLKRSSYAGCIK